jgi:AraC-like DNA-binding protein
VSSSQIFAAEALLRSVHEMAESFALNASARELPLIHADPYLNSLLLKYCEAALADQRGNVSQLRTRVENAMSSLLPHGRVVADDIARSLGMSKRTLARKLSDEGLNFTEVLQQLRRDLAVRYLDDPKLHISKIAWLLGFNEVSAFTHAFKRWTGKTPSQMRIGSAGATRPVAIAPSVMASSSGEC